MYMSTVFGCFGIDIVLMIVHVLNNCYVFVFCNVPYGIMDIMASLCQYHMYINQYKSIALACICIS